MRLSKRFNEAVTKLCNIIGTASTNRVFINLLSNFNLSNINFPPKKIKAAGLSAAHLYLTSYIILFYLLHVNFKNKAIHLIKNSV